MARGPQAGSLGTPEPPTTRYYRLTSKEQMKEIPLYRNGPAGALTGATEEITTVQPPGESQLWAPGTSGTGADGFLRLLGKETSQTPCTSHHPNFGLYLRRDLLNWIRPLDLLSVYERHTTVPWGC